MNLKFFRVNRYEIIASQLRKPSGLLAKRVGNQMNKANRFLHDFTIQSLKLKDHDEILEIGFGNGKFFGDMFRKANHLKISGLEYSKKMWKIGRQKNPALIKSGQLDLRLGSSDSMPFEDNTFDKVFCSNVIYFWDKPSDHLKEVYRVLKPGGKFYTSFRSDEYLSLMPFAKYGFNIYNETTWLNILEENGFLFSLSSRIIEPGIELNGKLYRLESFCLVSEKPNPS